MVYLGRRSRNQPLLPPFLRVIQVHSAPPPAVPPVLVIGASVARLKSPGVFDIPVSDKKPAYRIFPDFYDVTHVVPVAPPPPPAGPSSCAWGQLSWGTSWANSWGCITFAVISVSPSMPSSAGGAYPSCSDYPGYWCGRKRKRVNRTLPLRAGKDYRQSVLDRDVGEYYEEILGSHAPQAVKREAMAVVRPYIRRRAIDRAMRDAGNIMRKNVNWNAVKRKPDVMSEILEIWLDEVEQIRLDDDEVILVLYS